MRARMLAIAAVGALLVDQGARADVPFPVVSSYCFEQATAFVDASVGDHLTGTFTRSRGVHVQFVRESDSIVVNDVYTDDSDGNGGCVTLDGLNGTTKLDAHSGVATYTIKVLREAKVLGHTLLVRGSTGGTIVYLAKTGFNPTANHLYSYGNGDTWVRLGSSDAGMVMGAAQWAIHRQPAGLSPQTFTLRTGACPGAGGSCFDEATEILWIGHPDRKFVIGHTLGLAVQNFRNGHNDAIRSDGAVLDGCVTGGTTAGWLVNSKECSTEAAYEGFALFYSAAAFNDDGTDADCDFENPVNVDWSANGTLTDQPEEDRIFSCESSPAPSQSPPINGTDYLGQKCIASGLVNNRSVAYDWMRALWDLHTGAEGVVHYPISGVGYSVADIYTVWDLANPNSWNSCATTRGSTAGNPYLEVFWNGPPLLRPTNGLTDWENVLTNNGVQR